MTYDAKDFCCDAILRWGSYEPELLEWTEEVHNCMAILAQGIRDRTIQADEVFVFLESVLGMSDVVSEIENAIAISFLEFVELDESSIAGSVTPMVKEIIRKQYERWQRHV